ncbi:MAG: hypothetical protein Q7T45_13475 [Bradyrhizobium sp.]|uniref:hypothetical protein n=1 Tax=Bradyrhizobium sp. TaxID=376 RepID=UPI00271A3D51|nr:hypothetical protein [Bradyrhizobium sp.]MDO8398823.1 hypothetical protein [Bradyrhizobium sp.]
MSTPPADVIEHIPKAIEIDRPKAQPPVINHEPAHHGHITHPSPGGVMNAVFQKFEAITDKWGITLAFLFTLTVFTCGWVYLVNPINSMTYDGALF